MWACNARLVYVVFRQFEGCGKVGLGPVYGRFRVVVNKACGSSWVFSFREFPCKTRNPHIATIAKGVTPVGPMVTDRRIHRPRASSGRVARGRNLDIKSQALNSRRCCSNAFKAVDVSAL